MTLSPQKIGKRYPFSFHIQSFPLSYVTVTWSSLLCFFRALDLAAKPKV